MVPSARVIIDTDPGVDDVLAMLLALAAEPEDVEILLISVSYGNVDVQKCLRNVVSMFHVIEQEVQWRRKSGYPEGFAQLKRSKPLVAIGADGPLGDQLRMADYFHGMDGLGGIYDTHQHLSPPETWKALFNPSTPWSSGASGDNLSPESSFLYTPSLKPSHVEILHLLDTNPPDTISIIAIGPLTNLALAASQSPKTMMRAKSILIMGGAIGVPGNITPLAEFNTYADATAAARLYALTSPNPASTIPPRPPPVSHNISTISSVQGTLPPPLPSYPPKAELGDRRLRITLFPLDITEQHVLRRDEFLSKVQPLIEQGSPLAEWTHAFLSSTLRKMETLHHGHEGGSTSLSLHDPMCVWYALTGEGQQEQWVINRGEDIRVETAGQWTRGACIVDRRDRKKIDGEDGEENEIPGDSGGWLSAGMGNRLDRCVGTPGRRMLAPFMLDTIFG